MRVPNAKPLVEESKVVSCYICKQPKQRKKCRKIPITVTTKQGFDDINTYVWVCKKHKCLRLDH